MSKVKIIYAKINLFLKTIDYVQTSCRYLPLMTRSAILFLDLVMLIPENKNNYPLTNRKVKTERICKKNVS